VQEYKNAPSLAEPKRWTEAQIQQIAIAVLEILVDLQTHEPPIIHRDIKPENLLVDDQLNVYLVDFGFAHLEGEDLAASSTVKGTFGFMPPEQLFNRSLTPASDLYSLGITLISLLTRTPSAAIAELFDDHYRLQFKSRLLQRSPQWSSWLEKMTAANLQQRYPNAAIALQALQGIHKQRPQLSLAGTAALFITLGSIALGLALGELRPAPLPFRSDQQQQIARDLQQLQTTHHCPGCRLAGTNLSGADLRSIDLTGANLAGANLSGADLRGAYLAEANLRGAKLAGANLASTDLRDAIMPDGSIYP
jgi:serine/threonine protein kinase